MRSSLSLLLLLTLGSVPAAAQGFAGPQPREAGTRPPVERVSPLSGAVQPSDPIFDSITPTMAGSSLPRPLGLSGSARNNDAQGIGVLSARVFAPGIGIQLPYSAMGTNSRLIVVPNNDGGQSAILYNPGTGAVVEYVQTLQVDRIGRGVDPSLGTGLITQPGILANGGVSAGYRNVTTDPATGAYLSIGGGLPAINNLSPSYDFRANAPVNFGPIPATPSSTSGTGIGAPIAPPVSVGLPAASP